MPLYRFDRFEFDTAEGRLFSVGDGSSLRLRPQAATVLEQLLQSDGALIERERLSETVWGRDRIVDFEAGIAALMRELRRALDELGGDQDLIETVPRRGYRLRAEVRRVSDTKPDEADPEPHRAPARSAWPAALIAITVIAAILAAVLWRQTADPEPEKGIPPSQSSPALAIVPFEVYGEAPLLPEHSSILLADTLLAELWREGPEDLSLLGRIAIQPYLQRDDLAAAVAEDLGLTLLLEGTLRADPQRWWLDLRLLRVPPGKVLWTHRIESTEPLDIAEVANDLAEELQRQWPEIVRKEKRGTADFAD